MQTHYMCVLGTRIANSNTEYGTKLQLVVLNTAAGTAAGLGTD